MLLSYSSSAVLEFVVLGVGLQFSSKLAKGHFYFLNPSARGYWRKNRFLLMSQLIPQHGLPKTDFTTLLIRRMSNEISKDSQINIKVKGRKAVSERAFIFSL